MRSHLRAMPSRPVAGPSWAERALAAATHGLIGALCALTIFSNLPMGVLMLGAIFYAVFVHQGRVKWGYFQRFHFLQGLMLFFLLYVCLYLILLLFQLTVIVLGLTSLISLATAQQGALVLKLASQGLLALAALSQAVMALAGRTPRLPVITPNVVFWV